MMQRPINKIIDTGDNHIWETHYNRNLKSAIAFAALTTPNNSMEKELYENIVEIPHYDSKYIQLLDREDEKLIVYDDEEGF